MLVIYTVVRGLVYTFLKPCCGLIFKLIILKFNVQVAKTSYYLNLKFH